MSDPIRATLGRWNDHAPWTAREGRLQDALCAVLDLCDASCALVEREAIIETIAENLGVTDGTA